MGRLLFLVLTTGAEYTVLYNFTEFESNDKPFMWM